VGDLVGANPVDRGKPGSKYHLLIDAGGLPLEEVKATLAELLRRQPAVTDDEPPAW
jgi:hypothetical protein